MANRVIRPVRRLTKPPVTWSSILTHAAGIALGAGKSTGPVSALGVSIGLSGTLLRTRGQLFVHFDPTTGTDTIQIGIGLGLFSTDAFTAGAASLPGPLTDAGYDWVYHRLVLFPPAFTATESDQSLLQNIQIEIDSKAMRKQKDAQTLGWMIEMIILSGGGTFDFGLTARHLYKL